MVAVEAAGRARSEAQRRASRKNGAKSKGPVTAEGKARSSANALAHGLWAAVHLVVPGEDPRALEALRAGFAADYAARGIVSACLADRLALTFWKLLRCDRLEAELARLPARPQRGWLEAEPGMPAALSRLPERALLERARARLDRFLLRAIALLEGGPAPRRRRRRSAGAEEELALAAPPDPAASESPRAAGAAEEVGGVASVVLEPRADHPAPSAPPSARSTSSSRPSPSSSGADPSAAARAAAPDPGPRMQPAWTAGSEAGHDGEGAGAGSSCAPPALSSLATEPRIQSAWTAGSLAGRDEKGASAPASPSTPTSPSSATVGPASASSLSSSGADTSAEVRAADRDPWPRIEPCPPLSSPAPGARGAEADPAALVEASARRLLAEGRAGEAVAVLRRLPRPPRAAAESVAADELPSPEDQDAAIDAAVAELSPEARALWDSLGYEHWVVPPLRGRMCLSSLTNEWVTPADRWRVLEEVRRLGDPAETARVLARFHEAGLDPGRDHPDFATAGSGPAARPPEPAEPVPTADEEELPPLLRNNPVLRRVVEESDAYHAACRLRQEAERWRKHAQELGVPIPAHGLAAIDAAARIDPENPRLPAPDPAPALPEREPWPLCPGWHGRPRDPRTGALLPLAEKNEKRRNEPEPSPPSAESEAGPPPAPPLPDPPDWPFAEADEPAAIAEARAAREPRPAPPGKTTTPKTPPEPIPWTPARLGPFAPRWYLEQHQRAATSGDPTIEGPAV